VKNAYRKIIRFGIPLVVLMVLLMAMYQDMLHPGDPEFGALGGGAAIVILLAFALAIYFVIAIIIFIIKKNNLYLISWAISIVMIIAFALTFAAINKIKKDIRKKRFEKEYKIEKIN
jgi:ABC-type multidrug transport system fused ATPase/permease subunit